jgi:NADH:ubiquinone oxidoreductase subunit F (NADH-binding)/(2Fe-2S) ferredoxin/NAD-dependent dihydropyrimidine dehydrogenase PreA subunit
MHLMLCTGTGCVSNKAFRIRQVLEETLAKHQLQDEIAVVPTGCNGFCAQGPVMVVQPDGIFYQMLTERDIPELVEEHFLKGRPLRRLMFTPSGEQEPVPRMSDIGFFGKQRLVALKNRGLIDPERIDDYIARDGYAALAKVLMEMTPEEVVEEVKQSGLRGRGGAGFPAGRKWESRRKARGEPKYIVCNADEGDPGAFMDRSIIESDPHAVLEGMIIGAYAIGASRGYVYIRNEYPLAVERLGIAIRQARDYGLLGTDILGRGFDFDIEIRRGAGAFVCGETTSLVASIEGQPPEPRQRPPRTTLWGKPVNINNVETWANVPAIILRGAAWFASIGTEKSKGTKVFSLVGKVRNTGLVEVPMGISIREIVFDIGGGMAGGKRFKAIQTGGPSGGCIPASLQDLPIDYEQLTAAGSMMGSGGLIVMDESDCMVDVARYFLEFLTEESCGKCTACREGVQVMYQMLAKICAGQGTGGDIDLLEELSHAVIDASLCGLGKSAPNPVLSTLRYFRDEYEAHIRDRCCPACVCKPLFQYRIDENRCNGCGACKKNCPYEAIEGTLKSVHGILQEKCTKCGACYDVCPKDAVTKIPNRMKTSEPRMAEELVPAP